MKLPINKYVIIGSYALGTRYAKDIDVICYEKDIQVPFVRNDDFSGYFNYNGRRIECLFADKQESFQYILDMYDGIIEENGGEAIASKETLLGIKKGHITFPSKNWEKHIADYHVLYQSWYYGEFSAVEVNEIAKLHKKSTEYRLGKKQKTPKLKGVTKEEFFDDFVTKYYEHDNIHRAMAHKEHPMYSYMQPDLSKVECSKDLWNKFSYEEKIQCVQEEAYVIALERHIIPTMMGDKIGLNSFEAFKWALMRICTTLCSGWFRQFAIDNYFTILNSYNANYINKFEENIDKYENLS